MLACRGRQYRLVQTRTESDHQARGSAYQYAFRTARQRERKHQPSSASSSLYPFNIAINIEKFVKRKFDNQPENELKILEELYYHSAHNPRYIQELTTALKESGIMPYETKEVELKVKFFAPYHNIVENKKLFL